LAKVDGLQKRRICFLSSVGRVGSDSEVGMSDEGGWISRDGWREEIGGAGGGRKMEEEDGGEGAGVSILAMEKEECGIDEMVWSER